MRCRGAVFAVVMALGMGCSVAGGSELRTWEILQPFDLPNGIEVSRVTYVGYYAGFGVEMTCWPNVISNEGGGPASDHNAASIAGLHVKTESDWPIEGDTLRAVLDVSSMKSYRSENGWPDTVLVAATVQCIVATAAQWQAVKFVTLKIAGERRYRSFGGVYRAERFRCGPLRRQFY